jgi:hypothetical protein
LNITHTWTADLAVWIVAPDRTSAAPHLGIGGDTDGFVGTWCDSNAPTSIFQQWYPYTGTFRPFGDMGQINLNGINPNGTWYLRILDTYPFAGCRSSEPRRSITFGTDPCKPFIFESSDLPIIRISTGGQADTKRSQNHGSDVGDQRWPRSSEITPISPTQPGQEKLVLSCGKQFTGILPKNPTPSKPADELGEDKDVSLLGLPETSDFPLMANFSDKTLMRNALAYDLFRQMGHYASRTRFLRGDARWYLSGYLYTYRTD